MATSNAPAIRFTASGIEYLDFGTGPHGTVVFAHGFRDSAQGWVPVARELVTSGWRVLGGGPSSVAVPTLLVTTDDQFFTEDMLRQQVAPRFKQIRVEAVHGAGHYPHLERPAELAGLIARFLADSPQHTVERTRSRGGML
jgi:pimeloyl-ACP methyl ester carboxylesterase